MTMTQVSAPPLGAIETVDMLGLQVTAVQTAMELDLFTVIDQGYHELEAIAEVSRCSQRGLRVLLDALCPLGLLVKERGRYALSPTAAAYLVRGSSAYCVPIYLAWLQNRERFRDFVRAGQAALDLTAPEASALWAAYAAPARLQWPLLAAATREHWAAAKITPDHFPGPRILDVGCGAGYKSFCLLQDDPAARVTALDRPEVLAVAADIAAAMGVADRVRLTSRELAEVCAGATFDLVLFGSLLHYFDDAAAVALVEQARAALSPRGVVVVYCGMVDPERSQSRMLLSAIDVCNAAPWAAHRSADEYRAILERAGCAVAAQAGPFMVVARRARP